MAKFFAGLAGAILFFVGTISHAVSKPVELSGIGLLFPKKSEWLITPEQFIPMHESADSESKMLGLIRVIAGEQGATHYTFVQEDEEENPDASFLQKLRGNTTRIMVTEHVLPTYKTEKNKYGLLVEEQDKSWLRTPHGWFERGDYLVKNAHFVMWKDAIDYKELPEFKFPDSRKEERAIEKIEIMRRTANYMPVGDVAVYKSPDDAAKLMDVQLPLRFSVLQREGNWMKVFLAVGTCDTSLGKSDYREGGTGWVKIIDDDHGLQMIRQEQTCR